MKKIIVLGISISMAFLLYISCSSDSDSIPNNPTNLTATEFFGITTNKTMSGVYAKYVADDLRSFTSSNDTWTFTASIGEQTTYNNYTAYPVTVMATRVYFPNPTFTDTTYTYTVFLNVVNNELYWYGGSYCGLDIPLSSPVSIAPYPLQGGMNWTTINNFATQINQCNTITIDSLKVSCIKETNVTIRQTSYPEVYILRLSVVLFGEIRYYELWYAPSIGPVRGAGFYKADDSTAEFTKPKDGWETTTYSK